MDIDELTINKGWFRKKYSLSVRMKVKSLDTFENSWPELKHHLLKWKRMRKRLCHVVLLTVKAPAPLHEEIENYVNKVHEREKDLAPFLQSLELHVTLKDSEMGVTREYSIMPLRT